EATGGSFFLSETVVEPGFPRPPPHRHERLHDMFYVLDGELTFQLGEDTQRLPAGSFVCVPPGTVHTFSNPGDTPVRFLNFNTPPGGQDYIRDLRAPAQSGSLPPATDGRVPL